VKAEHVALTGGSGLALAADAWGAPASPRVLLLHGGGQTRHSWGATARALAAAGFRAVSCDLRGHGDSHWAPDRDYSIEAFADDVVAVCRRLDGAAVVGASLGGMAAMVAADRGPMSALVLVDVAAHLEAEGVERIVAFMTGRPEGFSSLDEAADAIAGYLPHRPRPTDLSGLAKNLRVGADGRYRWHWDPAFMANGPRASRDPEYMEGRARLIGCPTLLVRGRMSDILSEEGARRFLGLVPHAEYVDVSGAGHMVAGDRNDAFTDAVVSFLRRVLGPDPGGTSRTAP